MKTYEEFMKKAHGALILERENDIILEVRASKDYLNDKIDVVDVKVDRLDFKVDNGFKNADNRLERLELELSDVKSQLTEIITILKK